MIILLFFALSICYSAYDYHKQIRVRVRGEEIQRSSEFARILRDYFSRRIHRDLGLSVVASQVVDFRFSLVENNSVIITLETSIGTMVDYRMERVRITRDLPEPEIHRILNEDLTCISPLLRDR